MARDLKGSPVLALAHSRRSCRGAALVAATGTSRSQRPASWPRCTFAERSDPGETELVSTMDKSCIGEGECTSFDRGSRVSRSYVIRFAGEMW